jgi:hypothetical protein
LAASAKVSKEREFLGRRCQVFEERDIERETLGMEVSCSSKEKDAS